MDFLSHGLIGAAIGLLAKRPTKAVVIKAAIFGLLPDVFQIPYYLGLGHLKNRPYNWPEIADWEGFRGTHTWLDACWDIPHSFFFLFLVIIPLVKLLKQSPVLIYAYASHILFDIPTHTGEWAVKFLYPFPIRVSGLTDAWAWGWDMLAISWATLAIVIIGLYKFVYNKA
jgi:hypothetical protein